MIGRLALWFEYKGICQLCGKYIDNWGDVTRDHRIPKSLGGLDTKDNLILAHKGCNLRRGNMTVEEFKNALSN